MKTLISFIKIMLPLLLIISGLGYAGYIYYGYAKGQKEYKALQEEYTKLAIQPGDTDENPDETSEEKKKKEDVIRLRRYAEKI